MGIINTDLVICPGCGKVWENLEKYIEDTKYFSMVDEEGDIRARGGECSKCGYENGTEPYRLLTIGEILEDQRDCWCDVALGKFLRSLIEHEGRINA